MFIVLKYLMFIALVGYATQRIYKLEKTIKKLKTEKLEMGGIR